MDGLDKIVPLNYEKSDFSELILLLVDILNQKVNKTKSWLVSVFRYAWEHVGDGNFNVEHNSEVSQTVAIVLHDGADTLSRNFGLINDFVDLSEIDNPSDACSDFMIQFAKASHFGVFTEGVYFCDKTNKVKAKVNYKTKILNFIRKIKLKVLNQSPDHGLKSAREISDNVQCPAVHSGKFRALVSKAADFRCPVHKDSE